MRREPALYRGSDNQRENKNPGFRIRNADCCAWAGAAALSSEPWIPDPIIILLKTRKP